MNFNVPSGSEGLIVEDQIVPAQTIVESLRDDFNNTSNVKAQFKIVEVNENDVELTEENMRTVEQNREEDLSKPSEEVDPETGEVKLRPTSVTTDRGGNFPVGLNETENTWGESVDVSNVNEKGERASNDFSAPSLEAEKTANLSNRKNRE